MGEKFTQGEWEVREREANFQNIHWFGFEIIAGKHRICMSQTDDDKNIPQMQANAALLKTAPEMLEMLDEVGSDLAVALASTPGIECEVWQEILKEDVQKICTVLKKARGEK